MPPSCELAAPLLLFRIRPCWWTLKSWYWLCDSPEPLAAVMLTTGTPLGAVSMLGRLLAAALGSGVTPAARTLAPSTGKRINCAVSTAHSRTLRASPFLFMIPSLEPGKTRSLP